MLKMTSFMLHFSHSIAAVLWKSLFGVCSLYVLYSPDLYFVQAYVNTLYWSSFWLMLMIFPVLLAALYVDRLGCTFLQQVFYFSLGYAKYLSLHSCLISHVLYFVATYITLLTLGLTRPIHFPLAEG